MTTREQWLAERKTGIGASDSAAILGVSPWRSPVEVWADKTGLADTTDAASEAAEWGIRLEPVIAQALAERTGRDVSCRPAFQLVRHPMLPWLFCTPDAEDSAGRVVQIKTCSAYKASEWRDEPPLQYQVQVQHELEVLDRDEATLVVLIGGQKLRYYDVPRNQPFIAALRSRLEEFWVCVQERRMPSIDGTVSTAQALARLHPQDSGATEPLDFNMMSVFAEWEAAKAAANEAESRKRLAENMLRAAMGDASYGVLPDGNMLSLLTQTRAAHAVKESTYRVLRRVNPKRKGSV